ncbi:MAG: NAD(P)H-hydrate dehydratase [Telmatospirillum sp.]|nr:NAD(P)H-hydrate dehydratase [Telmatospirillum sp.]
MYDADRAAMEVGISGETLMEAAGWQIARAVAGHFRPRPVAVLCGPGNNGGDGFVVARLLRDRGWPVRLFLLGSPDRLKGDARTMAARWRGGVEPLSADPLPGWFGDRDPLIIDALFGAGLSRAPDGVARAVIEAVSARSLDVVAVDVPSGVDGSTGAVPGVAFDACLTVTFFRAKPGHFLFPGRARRGALVVGDIGIPASVLDGIASRTFVNGPALWGDRIPWPSVGGNKYDRGHLLVAAGATLTGAARLAAAAARRAGAGLVTLLAPDQALAECRAGVPGLMVRPDGEWDRMLADRRINAAVLGPGLGVGPETVARVQAVLAAGKRCLLDADALSSFAGTGGDLWTRGGTPVLTPHDGEFRRLFPAIGDGDRLSRARAAALESGAVVLLKGPDQVIAAPDGRAAICDSAPPTLATGGTGDVLSGLIGGLLAQGMAPFEAACLGAWMHAEAAVLAGPALIAEDLNTAVADVWRRLSPSGGGGPSQDGSPSAGFRSARALRPRGRRRYGPRRE